MLASNRSRHLAVLSQSGASAEGAPAERSPAKVAPPRPPRRLVETLRKQGVKVRVHHLRYVLVHPAYPCELTRVTRQNRGSYYIMPHGGETHVDLLLPDGREVHGRATCSLEDVYDRRLGVWLAVRRATAAAKRQTATPRGAQ